jgi:RimJ/RimL family protein N-acetyltransferase
MSNSKLSESIKTQRLQLLPVSEDLATNRIQANVRLENVRSIEVIQRLGFEQEGMARAQNQILGKP